MRDIIDVIEARRSIKKYKDDPIDKALLEKICRAGTLAPSGKNKQSAIILCITNKEIRDRLSKLNAEVLGVNIDPFYNAPVVCVVLANKDVFTYLYDGSLVCENMMLEATSLGISSCWIHRAKEVFLLDEGKKLLEELGINGNYEGIGNVILGYSDMIPKERNIKDNYVFYID